MLLYIYLIADPYMVHPATHFIGDVPEIQKHEVTYSQGNRVEEPRLKTIYLDPTFIHFLWPSLP